jgi:predicted histone-like DNA-binding protein
MAVNYKLRKNNIKGNKHYGKYYAQTVHSNRMTLSDIMREIEANCSLKESDVIAVMTELKAIMRYALQDGQIVDLDDLGSFYINVKSIPVDKPEDFKGNKHLLGFELKYRPAAKRTARKDHHLTHTLTIGCQAKREK